MNLTSAVPPVNTFDSAVFPWSPDQGDGTFRNPVIFADYSDPDVIRVGEDFFLTASSFHCTPGLPILHSRDLVNWTLVNHAVKNLPHPRYRDVQPGCGIWAPAMRFHDGRFWIFFPMPDEGIYLTTAKDPAGQWTEPRLVQEGRGLIDPCPFWDDDGKAYLVHAYAASRAGIKHQLRVCPMHPDGSGFSGAGRIVFHEPERHPTIEGPKFLKQGGWYYILAPAGGVQNGWQVALRSRDIFGPYEDRIVLEQGDSPVNGPHQGALVDLPNGEWWFIHFQDVGVYGRVVHLQPVQWQDGWPVIGQNRKGTGAGQPVLTHRKPGANLPPAPAVPPTSDEFDATTLGLQWQWQANHDDNWFSLSARRGCLRLFAQPGRQSDLMHSANVLLQKFPARSFRVETELEFSPAVAEEESGLIVMGADYAALAVRRTKQGQWIVFRNNTGGQVLAEAPAGICRLAVNVADGGVCRFAFRDGAGRWHEAPQTFRARAGAWVGAKAGLYSVCPAGKPGGHADFNYFRFSAGERAASETLNAGVAAGKP
jgi:beta-xylosidase